jgi:dipeptidyl aminopeptidase/acylaminoacyl peptidase
MRMRIVFALAAALAIAGCQGVPAPAQPELDYDVDEEYAEEAEAPEVEAEVAEQPASARETVGALILDGTPEIPGELRARLSQYLETRSASLQSISDDGSEVLITTRFADTSQLHHVRRPLGARTQITFAEEPAGGASFAPGSTTELVYTSDIGGNEQHQLFHFDLTTGVTTQLTDPNSRTVGYAWSRDGSRLAFANNRRNGRDFDLWISDGRNADSAELLVEVDGYWYPSEFSHDGSKLLAGEYISITDSRVHLIDVATGEVERLTPEEPRAAYRHAVFARDGQRVYITSDREGEFVELYELELASGAWRPLSRDISWDVTGLALAPDGRTLAFTTNEGGIDVLRLLDTRTRRHRQVEAVPAGVIGGLQFAGQAPVLGFTLSSASRTGDAYTFDVRRRALTRWTESEIGGLNADTFIEPEIIKVESFDGLEVPGLFYTPPGEGPHPVVVFIHGGPEAQSRPRFSSLTQFLLAERGIAVIYPNVRGSTGYGKTYVSLDNGKKREHSVKDIGAFLDWIRDNPNLDEERVAVYGGSYGGYMVLASLIHFGDRLRAGVNVVGISNFVTFLENTADYRRDLRRVEYGDERDPAMREFLERISPRTRASEIGGALFVAHGANDPRVPASEAEQIVQAVREEGHDTWYLLALNEGHGFSRKENRDVFLQLAVLFFEEHLLPKE